MRKRIFHTLLLMTLLTMLVTILVLVWALFSHSTGEQFDQLRNETRLTAAGVSQGGLAYLENLTDLSFRVTWITPEGAILFDSDADTAGMENHLAREEIRDALEKGYGESRRFSPTLSETQLYTAIRLDDGTILRLSITQAAVWGLVFTFLFPVLGVTVFVLALSFLLASRLAKRIVDPINSLNLDHPLGISEETEKPDEHTASGYTKGTSHESYTEIRPLLNRLEEQRQQLMTDREELTKTSLIRQEFTANASHELKTPLHVISGYAELLESGMVPADDIQVFAGKIRAESQRMSKLVEDIIDLSSLDSGAVGAKWEKTDLYRVTQNAVESLLPMAQEQGKTLTLQGDHTMINGIPDVLYSMVYNLCLNAIKYSGEGKRIQVRIQSLNDEAVLSVKDEGIGIPQEDLDRIFERFYRVDKSRSKEVGGTGLGLSIVKHGARIHHAEITVESQLGAGSTFTVRFRKA